MNWLTVRIALFVGLMAVFVALAISAYLGQDGNQRAEQEEDGKPRTVPEEGDLSPGRYATQEFRPAMSFGVDERWQVGPPATPPETTDNLTIAEQEGLLYVDFANVQEVYDPKDLTTTRSPPDDMATFLREHPNLDAGEPREVTVGGVSGVQFDAVLSPVPEDYSRECPEPCVPLYTKEEGITFGILQSEKLRFIVLDDVEGERVTIAAGGEADDFEAFLPKAEGLLETVEWTGS